MSNMYKVLGFWTAIFTIMFYLGHMYQTSLLFLAMSGFFFIVGFLKLSERTYVYVFGAFLTLFFVGFTYWTTFMMPLGGAGH